jgi:hypothetical protein
MSYIGLPPKTNFSSGLLDRYTGLTTNTVTLTHDIASENDIVVFYNNVKQDSTTYSVGGTGNKTLTLGGTLVSADVVEVHYLNIVGQTVNPSANSVGSSQLTADSITGQTAETSIADDDTIIIHDTSASALRKMTKANFTSGIGGNNTPIFYGELASSQTITRSTDTKVTGMTNVEIDTDTAFDGTTFTVPSGEGGTYYLKGIVTGDIQTAGQDGEEVRSYIYKNGSSIKEGRIFKNTGGANYADLRRVTVIAETITSLSAGDTIELYGRITDFNGSGNGDVVSSQSSLGGYKLIT